MKRKISKVLLTLFFFVLIVSICSAQNTARGVAAEKIAFEQNDNSLKYEPQFYFSAGHYMAEIESIVYSPDGQFIAMKKSTLVQSENTLNF